MREGRRGDLRSCAWPCGETAGGCGAGERPAPLPAPSLSAPEVLAPGGWPPSGQVAGSGSSSGYRPWSSRWGCQHCPLVSLPLCLSITPGQRPFVPSSKFSASAACQHSAGGGGRVDVGHCPAVWRVRLSLSVCPSCFYPVISRQKHKEVPIYMRIDAAVYPTQMSWER